MSPKVSIIIPVYNVEQYINECLQSVVNQTFADKIECIVVDDCGTDNSNAIVQKWVRAYRLKTKEKSVDFKFIQRDKNGGLSAARNSGIEHATGEYLYFLDSDDFLITDCIENLLNLTYKYPNVDMVQGTYCSEVPMLRDFSKKLPEFSIDQRLIKSKMLDYDNFPVMAQNRLVKRELITNNNLYFKEGIIHEDNYWTFFLSKYVSSIAICKEPTYFYRPNPNGISAKKDESKERKAFHTFVRDFSANIDHFLSGNQKTLILNYLVTILNLKYYKDKRERDEIIKVFAMTNTLVEKIVLTVFIFSRNAFIMHFLIRLYKMPTINIENKITNKLWHVINPRIREYFILPFLRRKMKGRKVTLLCNNCNGACILHDCGMEFNSPFVNLWLYPCDFIKYISNINHYKQQKLEFVSAENIPHGYLRTNDYPVGKLDDIYIYFQHYKSEAEAAGKWYKRTNRMDMSNLHAILVERDGCTLQNMIDFEKLRLKKVILTKLPHSELKSSCYIPGFENQKQLGQLMEIKPRQFLGQKYYDSFSYTDFLRM